LLRHKAKDFVESDDRRDVIGKKVLPQLKDVNFREYENDFEEEDGGGFGDDGEGGGGGGGGGGSDRRGDGERDIPMRNHGGKRPMDDFDNDVDDHKFRDGRVGGGGEGGGNRQDRWVDEGESLRFHENEEIKARHVSLKKKQANKDAPFLVSNFVCLFIFFICMIFLN
jgi:hypothetical protein